MGIGASDSLETKHCSSLKGQPVLRRRDAPVGNFEGIESLKSENQVPQQPAGHVFLVGVSRDSHPAALIHRVDYILYGKSRKQVAPADPGSVYEKMSLCRPIFHPPENRETALPGYLIEGNAEVVRVMLGDADCVKTDRARLTRSSGFILESPPNSL